MADFLLELRSEEIPARMQRKAADDLQRLMVAALKDAGLAPQNAESFVTPRRLALILRGLPKATEAAREERRGPRSDAPAKAVEGFCRGAGVTRDALDVRAEKKGSFFYAIIETPGRATADVLAAAIANIVRSFPWPKSMRWGAASTTMEALRWVRPLEGIVALFDGDVVPVHIDGVDAGRATRGHRFLSQGEIVIESADSYGDQLHEGNVIVCSEDRAAIIAEGARRAARDAGLTLIEDGALLAENAGLTEWPVPLVGRFDPGFLDVPREVVQLAMKSHQKYFALADADGNLAPAFVCTANIEAADGGAAIVAGNEKVLAARLSDARFFWNQDRKTPLARHAEKLGDIVFHEKLGTVADKVERIAKLAHWLAEEGIVPGADPALAEQAARLAKADLVTGMVYEFPELQGIMGGHYARAEGLADEVADAIRDHYKPVGQNDDVPGAPVTVAVSLADKLDTLVGFFGVGEMPTGSRDPFGLRRSAIAIIQLIVGNELRTGLRTLLGTAAHAGSADTGRALGDFFADRLKVQQRAAGVRHDLIDAVFALGNEDDLVRLLARVTALQAFVETDDGANLLAGYKRAANILKAEAKKGALPAASDMPDYDADPAESALIAALDDAAPRALAAVEAEQFEGAMSALAALRSPIDAFFESVTVNDDDPAKRAFRLGLLARARRAVDRVADFSKIEG